MFLSMASQVSSEDVQALLLRCPAWETQLGDREELVASWESKPVRAQAALLRRIAMLDEADFISELSTLVARGDLLPGETEWRTRELFTDMAEEFIGSNKTELAVGFGHVLYDRVREAVRRYSLQQMCEYVLANADEYMQITGREGNWAGSSEMAALARALCRPVMAYGNNWVSQDEVQLVEAGPEAWEVQPYFAAYPAEEPRCEAIRVFQTQGGGHYQMLS